MRRFIALIAAVWLVAGFSGPSSAEPPQPIGLILPEQRNIFVRDPAELPRARLPDVPPPPTVSDPQPKNQIWNISLDEAIRIALANAEAIRAYTGTTAVASGQTIYDAAVTNTQIDQAQGRFDPILQSQNTFNRTRTPAAAFSNPVDPTSPVLITAPPIDGYQSSSGISQTFINGATAAVNVNVDRSRFPGQVEPLNPQTGNNVAMSLTQPLLQGAGTRVNLAPVIIARINTERSFFQLKDSVQELVRGTIQAYWALVFAETNVWSNEQQVSQGQEAFDRADARLRAGFGNLADVAQARVSLKQFQANLITAQANLIQQEDALRNLMGLSPSDGRRLMPATPPSETRLQLHWEPILALAEERRPDVVELKLVQEADQQQLLIARNTALPQLNAVAMYSWNGLEGRTPENIDVNSGDRFDNWQVGVNFSVPLGLRASRATMRQQELILDRDRTNIDESLQSTAHTIAGNFRNLAQYYEQFLAYRQVREAALINLERQMADYRAGRATIYLDVLQAITDWGNAVTSESQALTNYNAELANLERQTGTILETHSVWFAEERYGSIGPLGRFFAPRPYPQDQRPTPNADRYPATGFQLPTAPELPGGAPAAPREVVPPGSRGQSSLEVLPPGAPPRPPQPPGQP